MGILKFLERKEEMYPRFIQPHHHSQQHQQLHESIGVIVGPIDDIHQVGPTTTTSAGDPRLVLTSDPKPRLRWTADLHERFVDAVTQLGGPHSQFSLSFDFSSCWIC